MISVIKIKFLKDFILIRYLCHTSKSKSFYLKIDSAIKLLIANDPALVILNWLIEKTRFSPKGNIYEIAQNEIYQTSPWLALASKSNHDL